MPRSIPSGLLPELYKLYTKPIHLVELYLTSPYTVPSNFYCVNNANITFGGQLYTALAAKRSAIKTEEGTIIQELNVQLDNVDTGFRNLISSGAFNRKRCDIKIVFADFLTTATDYIFLYSGLLDAPSGDNRWLNLVIRPFSIFEKDFPRRIYEIMCNWTFGDAQCGVSLSSYQMAGTTVLAGSTSSIIVISDPGRASDYFSPGYVLFTTGDLINQVRPVLGSDPNSISLRVALSDAPAPGDLFTVQKLCIKTPAACKDIFSNYLRFGGFPHTPKSPVI